MATLRDKLVGIYGDNSPIIQAIDNTLQQYNLLPEEKTTKIKAEGDPSAAGKAGENDKNAYTQGVNGIGNGNLKLPVDGIFSGTNKTAADNGRKDGETYVDNFNKALNSGTGNGNGNPEKTGGGGNKKGNKSDFQKFWDKYGVDAFSGYNSWSGSGSSKNSKSGSSKDNKTEVEITAKDSTAKGVEQARNSIQALNKDKNSRISIAAKR